MNRAALLLATALPLLVQAAPGLAQAAPAARPDRAPWTSEVWIDRASEALIDDPGATAASYEGWDRNWQRWITPADMPADLRARTLDATSVVVLEIDQAGALTGCRLLTAGSEPRLDALACDLFRTRGSFRPRYAAPGRPVAARWVMRIRWRTLGAEAVAERERRLMYAPAPPPPMRASGTDRPNPWPRLDWSGNLALAALPDVQSAYPSRPGRPAQGITSLDLLITAEGGITGCEIGLSSGNARLDGQACAVARRLELAYVRPCDLQCREERLPLQIVWRRGGSHVRFPLQSSYYRGPEPLRDPHDDRALTRYISYRRVIPVEHPPDPPYPEDRVYRSPVIEIRYTIGRDGLVRGCETIRSTGNAGIDAWFCERARIRLRYGPRTDVFGEPVEETSTFLMDLSRM